MIKNILILMLVTFSSQVYADDYDNFNSDGKSYEHFNSNKGDKYRDWNNILKLLVAQGIDTDKVNWEQVDANCAKYKSYPPTSEYNKCKYNNAMNVGKREKDNEYCAAIAEKKYFEYIKSNNRTTINNGNNNSINEKISLNAEDTKKFKDAEMFLCMRNLGWNDSDLSNDGRDNRKRRSNNRQHEK